MKKLLLFVLSTVIFSSLLRAQAPLQGIDSGFIDVDGGRLYFESAGAGSNIVLLHDGMVSHEIWDHQFGLLARYYMVTRYDRRGYGKSSDPAAAYSDVDDLNQLFISRGIEKAILFGMSSGGGCAIDFTLKYPAKVNGLILVGAVVGGYGYTSHMTYRGGHLKNPAEMSDPLKAAEYFVWSDPYEIYAANTEAKKKVASILMKNIHRPFNGSYYKPPERIAARFLSEIKVPCLVMVGEYDIPDVHAHAGVINFGINGSRREIIMNSGHLIPAEQPEEFNRAAFRFLRRNEFFGLLNSKGVDAAEDYFKGFFKLPPNVPLFGEQEMNQLGYQYLQKGQTGDAIRLFRMNATSYPGSWNVYDSLGEALLKAGQTAPAIENYRKSLEINPGNENAKKILREITN